MAKQSEELIDEAHGNLAEDRAKIKEFTELLNKAISVGEDVDPLAKISLAESFARLTGELTKNNSLLIELAKLRAKKEVLTKSKDGFDEGEADTMFDEIEQEPGTAEEDEDDDGSN